MSQSRTQHWSSSVEATVRESFENCLKPHIGVAVVNHRSAPTVRKKKNVGDWLSCNSWICVSLLRSEISSTAFLSTTRVFTRFYLNDFVSVRVNHCRLVDTNTLLSAECAVLCTFVFIQFMGRVRVHTFLIDYWAIIRIWWNIAESKAKP